MNSVNSVNNIIQKFGLRDKVDSSSGLVQNDPRNVDVITYTNTIIADTRDCVGTQSLADAQAYAIFQGYRPFVSGTVLNVSGYLVSPVIVTLNSVINLKVGDSITIKDVAGNTVVNGTFVINGVTITNSPEGTISINGIVGNGTYTGSGYWYRSADPEYPVLNNNMNIIKTNEMVVRLQTELKDVRNLSLDYINVPRDIIPLNVYIPDFISVSTSFINTIYPETVTDYTTFIPQEEEYLLSRMLGFFTSPLDIWRSYQYGSMSIPDQPTSPPLNLWNPPVGDWPLQPVPYPFQTVPTYRSANFSVVGKTGDFYLVLSGYGVYDLLDWTSNTGSVEYDIAQTIIMRKLLLGLLVPKQSYNGVDYIDLIINCSVTSNNVYPFGFGSFQRFVPGPGYSQNYQPGTNINFPGDPTVASVDSPVPFPNFRGNVCGPYNRPGAPFQRMGTRTVIQDLYLNGDLNNLKGESIILPNVPTENFPQDPYFGLNYISQVEITLGNISTTTNVNVLNAMRLVPNGFGAVTVRANGSGITYTNVYNSNSSTGGAGGIGPSLSGYPSEWVNHGIYNENGSINDPIAIGPSNLVKLTANTASASDVNDINYNISYYDLGANNGQFINNLLKFINFASDEIPDNDLIIQLKESERTIRSQSTNSINGTAMLDCPIRLSIGSTNGTQQYIESSTSLVAGASFYWNHRFNAILGKLHTLHLAFYTYDNYPIQLENLLAQRDSVFIQRNTTRLITGLGITIVDGFIPVNITYLFNPMDPLLKNRVRRYIQFIFKAENYMYVNPGLNITSYSGIEPYTNTNEDYVSNPYS